MPANASKPPPFFMPPGAHYAPLEVGVLVAGWHSGIVLPIGELGTLRTLVRRDPNTSYLSFGWGNRRFYMATHPGSGDAVAALFRSPSVLFIQAVSKPADLLSTDARIHWICVDRDELWRVASYIEGSLSGPSGHLADLGDGPLPNSRFYASTGHYSAAHTCNTWTVAALQYAGLRVRADGVIFAGQVAGRIGALPACPTP